MNHLLAVERVNEESDEDIIDKIVGGEAVIDNTAGAIVAVRDKIAGEGEAILKAAEQVVELLVEPSVEAILEATEESKDPGSNPGCSKIIDCL